MSTPTSFHNPSRTSLKTAREPCASTGHWRPHPPLLQIQMFNDSKQPISDHIGNPELIVCAQQGRKRVPVESSCYSWNRKLNFPTCEWNWKPILPTPKKLREKKKIFQLGEVFFKYTKYFSSFLALGKSINVPWKCWKLPGKTSQLLIKRKSHQL